MTSNNLLDEFHSSTLNPPLLQSLLVKLLSHPKILNGFLDVLKIPTVQACLSKMDEGKRAALIKTIELFAYGTIHEYYELKSQNPDLVWTLNAGQIEKLSMLSVASIARKQIDGINNSSSTDVEMMTDTNTTAVPIKKNKRKSKGGTNDMLSISYAKLAAELHIPNDGSTYNDKDHMRTLEDLLIQCIYSNVISAKLDQASKSLKSKFFFLLNLFLVLGFLYHPLIYASILQITVEPSVLLTPESIQAGGGSSGATSKGKKDVSASGGVYGSIFSRDMDTSTPESTNVEVSRMISTLESFLKQSNAVLSTLEHSSNEVASDRKMDEMRWREVQKVMDDTSSKGGRGGGDGGEGLLGMMRLGGDPMDVVDMGGRRQVKRSKGGHSSMYA